MHVEACTYTPNKAAAEQHAVAATEAEAAEQAEQHVALVLLHIHRSCMML